MIYLHLHANADLCRDDIRRIAAAPSDIGCSHIEEVPDATVQAALDALPPPHNRLQWEPGLLARLGFAAEVLADGTLNLIPPPQPADAGGTGDPGAADPGAAGTAPAGDNAGADTSAAGTSGDEAAGTPDTMEDTPNG